MTAACDQQVTLKAIWSGVSILSSNDHPVLKGTYVEKVWLVLGNAKKVCHLRIPEYCFPTTCHLNFSVEKVHQSAIKILPEELEVLEIEAQVANCGLYVERWPLSFTKPQKIEPWVGV